jgi:hypothetical protein
MFSMAMTAWSAKRPEQRDLPLGEGPDPATRHRDRAERSALMDEGQRQRGAEQAEGRRQVPIPACVGDLGDVARHDRPPGHRLIVRGLRERASGRIDLGLSAPVLCDEVNQRAVELIEPGELGLADSGGRGGDDLERVLDAGRGAANGAEDLGACALLFARLDEFGLEPGAPRALTRERLLEALGPLARARPWFRTPSRLLKGGISWI